MIKKFIFIYIPSFLFVFIFFFVLLISIQANETSENVIIFDILEHSTEDIKITPKEGFVVLDIAEVGVVEESTPHFILHLQDGLFMVDIYGTREQDVFISYIVVGEGSPAAVVSGSVGTALPVAIDILKNHFKDVRFLLLHNVLGGVHITAIMEAMKVIYDHGYGTYIEKGSIAESAGVDIFTAGRWRYAEEGAIVGIHNFASIWGGENEEVKPQELKSATNMQELLKKFEIKDTYYTFMRSIPADEMYYLSYKQMKQYNLINVDGTNDFSTRMGVQRY